MDYVAGNVTVEMTKKENEKSRYAAYTEAFLGTKKNAGKENNKHA